jgi:hypothetical protein
MLNRLYVVKECCKIVLLASATTTCIILSIAVFQLVHSTRQVNARMSQEFNALNTSIQVPLQALTADLGEIHKLTYTANLSAAAVGKASLQEQAMLSNLNPKLLASVNDLNATLEQTQQTVAGLKTNDDQIAGAVVTDLANLQPVLTSLNAAAGETHTTLTSLNTVISDPGIPALIEKSNETAVQIQQLSAHANATMGDIQEYVHHCNHLRHFLTGCKVN